MRSQFEEQDLEANAGNQTGAESNAGEQVGVAMLGNSTENQYWEAVRGGNDGKHYKPTNSLSPREWTLVVYSLM